uniref:Laminin, gamma 1 n=1 Tax=Astyanax mexicanus TaxID=7994 RepID=A0A8B9RND4_ASTMX
MSRLALVVSALALTLWATCSRAAMDECADESGRPQRCMPEFVNAAFNVTVVATNTCGSPPEEYCVQTGVTGVTKSCHICDARDPRQHHSAVYLTDYNNQADTTWWQSQTMLAGIQYPNSINLTLHLGKAFDITYVRLKFHTSRPESFAIYKRTREGGPWTPYQYYSGSCEKTYSKLNRGFIRTGEDEQQALCTDEFSDISPLTGGNVAFSTLEGRPSAYNFDNSPVLQDWVTATDIRVTLNRLNTFGDEVFNDPKVLKSYYYAISDFAVGGRCKCNGHASECVKDEYSKLVCNCKHNTEGDDCGVCKPFYNDRPWRRATADNPNECLPCNCNGKSGECYFDSELYRATGHGGHCRNCADNTDGPNCERCLDNYYRDGSGQRCLPCSCNPVDAHTFCTCGRGNKYLQHPCSCNPAGSTQECDVNTGRCQCKDNVDGFNCDRLVSFTHQWSAVNTVACSCSPYGTVDQQTTCMQVTGECTCLPHVTNRDCSACQPGFYNLQSGKGCERCNCNQIGSTNGHCDIVSGQCECQPGVTGQQCERCEVNFFGFSTSGCKPCDCDPEGSRLAQCREDGRCECRPGFVGARCDMCEENYFYNRSTPGCQQCPNCYSLVRDKVRTHRQKLHDLQTLIDNLGTQDTVSDKAFEDRLKEAEKAVMDLLKEAQASKDVDKGLLDRLKGINNTLTTQWNRLQNIRNTVDNTGTLADKAQNRVREAEKLIDRARDELDKAKDAISKVDIKTPTTTGDPNNMTLLAEEARNLAEKHKLEADQIEKTAKDANDTSTKAYNLLKKTLDGENKINSDIDELNKKYSEAKDLAKNLEKQASKVQAEAEEAGNKALKIYANLTSLPPFDVKSLEDEASKIKKEASDLDKLIDKTEKEYNDLRDDLKGKENEVRKLLEKGKTEQQTADQLLARADAAKALAEEAAKKGLSTYQEAQDILSNLRDFDKRVNDNKTAAEEAMKRIPEIKAIINAANDKTRQADAALGNAAADAKDAKSKAEEAEKIASNVQKGSAKTKADAEKAFEDTMKLDQEVNDMMKQLAAAEKELGEKKKEADNDMMMASMASDNAKTAEENARKAKDAVRTVLGTINDLLGQLGNIDKVDLTKLDQIDSSLKDAKDKMEGSELDKKLNDLNDIAKGQEAMINDYDRQIREIRADIANLNDIKNTLPEGCFNTPSLERP